MEFPQEVLCCLECCRTVTECRQTTPWPPSHPPSPLPPSQVLPHFPGRPCSGPPPSHPSITPSGRATVTRRRRRRRHLGRGKHVASGEEGSGRGRRARKVPAQVEESRPAGRQAGRQSRQGGKSSSSPVKEFQKLGPTWAAERLSECVSCLIEDWRRKRRKREGLTVHTIEQAACRQAECRLCFAIARWRCCPRHSREGRKEEGKKKCSADFSCWKLGRTERRAHLSNCGMHASRLAPAGQRAR